MHCSCNIVVKCVAQIHLTVKIYIKYIQEEYRLNHFLVMEKLP